MTPQAEHFLALRRSPLLRGVSDPAIEALLSDGTLMSYNGRCELFHEGDPGDEVYFILSGQVSINLRGADGANHLRRNLDKGMLLGELALFTSGRRTASAVIEENAELLCLNQGVFFALIQRWPEFAMALLRTLSERIIEVEASLREPR